MWVRILKWKKMEILKPWKDFWLRIIYQSSILRLKSFILGVWVFARCLHVSPRMVFMSGSTVKGTVNSNPAESTCNHLTANRGAAATTSHNNHSHLRKHTQSKGSILTSDTVSLRDAGKHRHLSQNQLFLSSWTFWLSSCGHLTYPTNAFKILPVAGKCWFWGLCSSAASRTQVRERKVMQSRKESHIFHLKQGFSFLQTSWWSEEVGIYMFSLNTLCQEKAN